MALTPEVWFRPRSGIGLAKRWPADRSRNFGLGLSLFVEPQAGAPHGRGQAFLNGQIDRDIQTRILELIGSIACCK